MPTPPAYLAIAADLRAAILSGELPAGAKLPSESGLMRQYEVSRTVAKWAIAVLKGEGIVEGRAGSGVYVRDATRLVRHARGRDVPSADGPTSPFARDAAGARQQGTWEHDSRREQADERIAARFGVEPGAPVMRTSYRFLSDGEPIKLSVSYEPLALTRGTPIEWPEDSDVKGVLARMDAIGIRVDEVVERVSLRSATADEVEALHLPARTFVHTIERTYTAGGTPVETADIVLPGGRYELVYRLPID
ncbi:GntR family transcriptional regulator [Micromonospora sp. AMSO1212t]|uniref:GntR family transcriptional regulator n=1 Tax=Micromonospora sp. AMSO1212t TaxID=2650565 RepID=UPI00124B4B2A|nr:GntR family transcriptional regulator [Micromonospora sp. AMSO1212t]KAB1909520.1 GntR family transcriptional regulator [Micromonospora sp. AMSO1212t]